MKSPRSRARLGLLAGAVLLSSPSTRAQTSSDAMLAESLYVSGKQLFDTGKYAEACPKLADSQRLEPAGGTVLLLATCYEKQGKMASAYLRFREASSLARRDGRRDRESHAEGRARALEPVVPRLIVRVAPATAALTGLVIKRDEQVILPAAFGIEIMVDPGDHVLSAEAPGRARHETRVALESKQRKEVSVPALEPTAPVAPTGTAVAPASASTATVAPASAPTATTLPAGPPVAATGGWRTPVAIGALSVGVIALGLGAGFFLSARSATREADDLCPETDCADPRAVDLSYKGTRNARIATVLMPVGLVGVGAGVVLLLTSRSDGGKTTAFAPWLRPGEGGGLGVRGQF